VSAYYTPTQYLDPDDPRKHDFLIIGGEDKVIDEILVFFKEKLGPTKTYFKCKAIEAECIKYIENTWFATKVTFANEWHEICKAFGASFNTVREGWILDNRVEKMHSMVFENKRGFGGRCYPKDLMGIISASEKAGYEPKLLKRVWDVNREMLKFNK
jgi:UDP-glucose 6-dehydrogenase